MPAPLPGSRDGFGNPLGQTVVAAEAATVA